MMDSFPVYAGSVPLGEISVATRGGRSEVRSKDAGVRSRGVKTGAKVMGSRASAAEFFEDTVVVRTGK